VRIRECVRDGDGSATAGMRRPETKEAVRIAAMAPARHWRHSWLLLVWGVNAPVRQIRERVVVVVMWLQRLAKKENTWNARRAVSLRGERNKVVRERAWSSYRSSLSRKRAVVYA
jgi:hypothetical protein